MNVTDYVKLVENLKLDFHTNLYYDITWSHSRKRCAKSVDISNKALAEHLKTNPNHATNVCHLKRTIKMTKMFGVIEGGENKLERIRSADFMATQPIFGT